MRSTEFDDPTFLDRLRNGDNVAYRALIRRFHTSLTNVAASIIGSRAQAEEVVQDAWLAVFASVARFEGRSSLTTWIFSIVLNRARTRIGRENRLVGLDTGEDRAVPLSAFKTDGHWVDPPRLWDEIDPERVVAGRQIWDHVMAAVEAMPAGQRAVITLRDIEGQDAEHTCEMLGISAENQRVLLHRARARVRAAIDALMSAPPARRSRTGGALGIMLAALAHAIALAFSPPISAMASRR